MVKKILVLSFALAWNLFAGGGDIKFEKYSLENGLTVILHEDHSAPVVSINVVYNVGSKNEVDGQRGFAHLFEHLMFKGGRHVSDDDFTKFIQAVGGTPRGRARYDLTNYWETLPGDALQMGLWLEADRMAHLLEKLDSTNFEEQKKITLNERNQRVNADPYARWLEDLFKVTFPEDHPYHYSVIGENIDIEGAKFTVAADFYRTFYVPNNAVLVVAGDIDKKLTKYWIDAYFGSIKKGAEVIQATSRFSGFTGPKELKFTLNVPTAAFYVNFPISKMGSRDTYLMDILAYVLATGRSSRLYQILVKDKQLVQHIEVLPWSMDLNSPLIFILIANHGVSAERLQKEFNTALNTCLANPCTDEEVTRARNQLKIWMIEMQQTNAWKSFLFGLFEAHFDNPALITREIDKYDDISKDEVMDFFLKYLTPENSYQVLYNPDSKE